MHMNKIISVIAIKIVNKCNVIAVYWLNLSFERLHT